MNNDAVFQADTEIDTQLRLERRQRRDHTSINGGDVVPTAHGRAPAARGRAASSGEEETPLLGYSEDSRSSYTTPGSISDGGDGGDERDNDDKWAGSADFDGLPWWKRPSVCCRIIPALTRMRLLTSAPGILAITAVYPLYLSFRWNNRSETQPYLDPHL